MKNNLDLNPDTPSDEDLLGFKKYVDTLTDMICSPNFKTPFCIGIYGKWGSGKTTFMHLLSNKLQTNGTKPHIISVSFNPWRYEKEEHLIIPFLKTIELEINKYIKTHEKLGSNFLDKLKKTAAKMGDVAAAFAYGMKADFKLGKAGFALDVSKVASREEELSRRRVKEAMALSETLSSLYYDVIKQLKEAVDEEAFRITVFIDDLDRCLPEKAVELLESIKLFLDIKGYLFVIGVAKEVVEKGIAYRYRYLDYNENDSNKAATVSPEEYLDKMIQLPLELPPIEPGKKITFIESLLDQKEFKNYANLVGIGVGENPRALKRFINLLAFISRLAETVKEIVEKSNDETYKHKELIKKCFVPLLYIKWALIVFKFPQVHREIKGNLKRLIELQNVATGLLKKEKSEDGEDKEIQIDDRLKRILKKGEDENLLFPDDDWLISRFVHLTEATIITAKETDAAAGYIQNFEPGDMVQIPKGKFLYGNEKIEKNIDYDYYIDVFPVTNKNYREFIQENPDHNVPFVDEDWAQPYNWDKDTSNFPEGMGNHPVVLVSYSDAVAFCKWRSNKEDKKYRLPKEEEWEKAARGTDGRIYPWGDDFDKGKCNTHESGVGKSTDVTIYPNGAGPFNCRDMAGNVWEWSESWHDENERTKVLRGGSWFINRINARCANRNWFHPDDRYYDVGFRCVRTLK